MFSPVEVCNTQAFVGGLFRDQGLDAVMRWLDPLFQPYAHAAYLTVRQQHGLPAALPTPQSSPRAAPTAMYAEPSQLSATSATVGHLALFNQHLQRSNREVEWVYAEGGSAASGSSTDGFIDPGAKQEDIIQGNKTTPVWYVKVMVDKEFYGRGRGNTKKAARNEAAKEGLQKLGVFVW